MSELAVAHGGQAYESAPLSREQEAASFRIVGKSGAELVGEFVDGADEASFSVYGRTDLYGPPDFRLFVRNGTDVIVVAKMLRAAAEELEKQKAPEGATDPFAGIETQ